MPLLMKFWSLGISVWEKTGSDNEIYHCFISWPITLSCLNKLHAELVIESVLIEDF